MAINQLPIDPEWQSKLLTVVDAMPVKEFERTGDGKFRETGMQASEKIQGEKTGRLMWAFAVNFKEAPDRKAEMIEVRVPVAPGSEPLALIGQRCVFGGLAASFSAYTDDGGKLTSSTWKFTAQSVADAVKPSQRPTPPAPTAPAPATDNGKVNAPA